jgi:diacylglycerol kinase (ATP)
MHVCPKAVLDDGLIEVTVIESLGMFELAWSLPVLYSENIYKHPKVRHFRASHILAVSGESVSIEVDGEPLGTLPLEVQVLPRLLRVARN